MGFGPSCSCVVHLVFKSVRSQEGCRYKSYEDSGFLTQVMHIADILFVHICSRIIMIRFSTSVSVLFLLLWF